jgi:hypothetical protein
VSGPPHTGGRGHLEGTPELAPAPIPEALLERAWPPRGRLRQYRLVRAHAFTCSRCQRCKLARLVAEVGCCLLPRVQP